MSRLSGLFRGRSAPRARFSVYNTTIDIMASYGRNVKLRTVRYGGSNEAGLEKCRTGANCVVADITRIYDSNVRI